MTGEVDGHGEGRQGKNEVETGMVWGDEECEGIKAQGCSSEQPSRVVPAPGMNGLVEWDVVGSAKGTLGVKGKGTWSGCM